jgi:type II secretory pathway pseudopilin PulG
MWTIIAFLAIILILLGIIAYLVLMRRVDRIEAAFQQNLRLAIRNQELEAQIERQHHTESTKSGIEDAGLILTSQLYRAQMVEGEIHTVVDMLAKSLGILGNVNQGPRAYPVDQPSGERSKKPGKGK